MNMIDYSKVLDFWFDELSPQDWWIKSDTLDQHIQKIFLDIHTQASQGECDPWRKTLIGRLAEIIVLDQFSRNIYRNHQKAFAQDAMALVLAQEAVKIPEFEHLNKHHKLFILLPFMHSESSTIHEIAMEHFEALGSPENLEFEKKHKVIIDRFGRYPHRNDILGRKSTQEEIEFLSQPGSSF